MKHFELQCFSYFLFLVYGISCQFSVTLRPEGQATVKYGEALQLTCFSNQVGGIIQIYYIKDNQPVVMVDAVPGFNNCVNHDINESTLSCDFETSEYVLVLNSPVHNRTIFCNQTWNRLTVSARTTVFVQVPFSEVTLSPYGVVNVPEDSDFTFNCSAKGGRPKGNITWYKDAQEVSATSSDILPYGSFFNVISTLTISFQKTESGTKVYCTAKNIDGDEAKMSMIAEIDVIYAPATAPNLTAIEFAVNEGKLITLQCRLPSLGYPPIIWSWMCGGDNLTLNASKVETQSTLIFTADKKYNGRSCQCWATSPEPLLSYNKTSETKTINVFYAPSTAPNLTAVTAEVNEGMPVTLQCFLPNLGYPSIVWSWVCGGDNLTRNASNIGKQSTLNFTAKREYNQKTCLCIARSPRLSLSYNKTSLTKNITVFYPPPSYPVMSLVTSLPAEEGHTIILQCSLSNLGNPYIRWSWMCGGDDLTLNARNVTTKSTLTFTADRKYNGSSCQCWATSPKPSISYNKSSVAQLIIVYFAVNITRVWFPSGSNNMTAGYPLRIKVEIYGNPSSTVIWKIKQSNEIIQQKDLVYNVSEFQLDPVTCLHTNDYTMTASNRVGNMSLNHFSLNVLCPPYLSTDSDIEPVVVGDEKQFVIKQNFIANPKPTVVWEQVVRSEGSIIQNGSHVTILTFSNGRVKYTTLLERKNVTFSDVGLYRLYLENGLGNYSSITQVIFKRRPDIPSNVSVTCSEPFKARVSWIAEFDGGGNQSFLIAFSQSDWNFEKISPVLTNGERGEKFVLISDLPPNTEHKFKVYAKNAYGNVSTKSVSCKIIDSEGENPLPLIASTVTGGLLVIIVIIVTTIFFYRRRGLAYNKARNSNIRLDSGFENEENDVDGDGLKENSLYVSAGPRDNEKPEVAVYAAVAKKVPQSDNNSNVYADVKKSTRKDTSQGTVSSEVKPKKGLFKKDEKAKHKKAKKSKNRPGETDVYENSEDIALSTHVDNVYSNAGQKGLNKQEERGYKNKDGLLYVEVNFDGKQGQDNPVIHGEDEKTDYATVEFPMPSALHKASGSEEL